jgi:hypothetical protein
VGAALLGAALVVGYEWLYYPWPTQISFEEVKELVRAHDVKSIDSTGPVVTGEVKLPGEVRHRHLAEGRFWAELPQQEHPGTMLQTLRNIDPNLRINTGATAATTSYRPPPVWSIVLLLGIPALVAALVGWPVGGRYWFPVLRRPRRS